MDYDKRTPLHVACANKDLDSVKFLLAQEDINVNVVDAFGMTPLQEARKHKEGA
jgi:ankyrin repeat protein